MNDDQDEFLNSNTDPTVVINGCDSAVLNNHTLNNGGNFSDRIGAIIAVTSSARLPRCMG